MYVNIYTERKNLQLEKWKKMHKSRRKSKLKESTTNNELQMHFNKCKWSEKRQSKAIWVEALGMYLCSICFHVSYMFQRKHLSKCGNMCGKLRLCLGANHIHTRKYISNHINVYMCVYKSEYKTAIVKNLFIRRKCLPKSLWFHYKMS